MIGKGENMHHLIYVGDLIEGLFLAAESDDALGEIFVLAGKKPLTSNEMVAEIAQYYNSKIPKLHAPLFVFLAAAYIMERIFKPLGIQPPLHTRRMDFFRKSFYFSQEHALNILGFQAKTEFSEGVRKTADWYRDTALL